MWHQTKLKTLFDVGSAKRVLKSQWQSEGIPFYRGREVTKLSSQGFVDNELFITEELYEEYKDKYGVPSAGDIVITAIGTIGNSYIVQEGDKFYYKDASVLCLKKTSDVDSYFINYWLKSSNMKSQLDEGNGATVDTLTIKKMKDLNIDLPPLSEQKRIVEILDEAFAGIDQAIANTEKNLASARELLESYLNTIFNQKGEGWESSTIGEVCTLKSGTTVPKNIENPSGEIPYIKVAEMNMAENIEGVITSIRFLNYKDIKESWIIPAGATIFPKRGGAIQTNKKRILLKDVCLDLNLMAVVPSNKILSEFLYIYFLNVDMKTLGNGSSIPQINNGDISPLNISYPLDLAIQKEIIKDFESLNAEYQKISYIFQLKLAALNELKQSLLQKAFRGELTADMTEQAQEDAA